MVNSAGTSAYLENIFGAVSAISVAPLFDTSVIMQSRGNEPLDWILASLLYEDGSLLRRSAWLLRRSNNMVDPMYLDPSASDPRVKEKGWKSSNAFLENLSVRFESCLPSFTIQPVFVAGQMKFFLADLFRVLVRRT